MIFNIIRTDFNFIFGQFSVARKLILNSGAIRPTGLLYGVPGHTPTSIFSEYPPPPPRA